MPISNQLLKPAWTLVSKFISVFYNKENLQKWFTFRAGEQSVTSFFYMVL